MEIIVRPYTEKDAEAVHSICMATAAHRVRNESGRLFLFKTSCDYYIDCEPENCFVASRRSEDGTQKVIGYALCALDCERYAKRFIDKYLPKIKEYSKLNAHVAKADVAIYGQFANFFPSHMRLAVLPDDRRQGAGEKLVEAVCAHLSARKSKGVVIIADKKNKAAQPFAEHCGFSFLRTVGSGLAYGMDF